jgi:two-component system sensor histidine kinase VicK
LSAPSKNQIPSSSSDTNPEKTEILYGVENVISQTIEHFEKTKYQIDSCMHSQGIIVVIETKAVWDRLKDLLESKNVKGRAITEITEENVSYCKELMKFSEVRHLDNVKGTFSISDKKEYHGTAIVQRSKPVIQIISSTVNAFVEQQQYFFDTLWDKSIPAELKIKEIEEGIAPDFIQTILDPIEIQKIQYNLLESATLEILLIFPTSKIFHYHAEGHGIIQLLKEVSNRNPNLQIKIMAPEMHNIIDAGLKLKEQYPKNIDIQYITHQSESKILILVVDKRHSLYLEIKEDKNTSNCNNDITNNDICTLYGLATFSNSKATVTGYASFFENLWRQSELVKKLKESEELQKDFVHIAAHELKNPIQPILGLSGLLMKHKPTDENEFHNIVKTINRNAKKLIQLSNDILDVTKIETKNLILNKELFNIKELIAEIIEDYKKNQRDNGNVKLTYKILYSNKDEENREEINKKNCNISIFADRIRINQVISNLLSNSMRFTDTGTIRISLEKKYTENKVFVNVKDTGCGIDLNILPKLFSKFTTKSKEGTGLGLYISKSIIEAHGGQIWADNNKDGEKGATFGFSIPNNN